MTRPTTRNTTHFLMLAGILFLLFFFIYAVNFTFLPVFTAQLIAAGFLLVVGVRMLRERDLAFTVDKGAQYLFILWAIYFLWVFLRTIETGFRDYGFLANASLLFGQVFVGSLLFAGWFFKRGYSFRALMRCIQIVILVQGAFIIFYFFSMEFKELTLKFIPEGGNIPALHPFRSRGLTHQAGADLAAFQATGMLITAYLIVKAKSWKGVLLDVAALGLLTGSVLLTGRTGFLILPLIAGYFVLYSIYTSGISRKLLTAAILFPLILVAGFSLLQWIYLQYTGAYGGEAISALTRWAFGELQQLITTGESRTTDVLLNEHLFFPERVEVFLFGDPTTHTYNRVSSDMGLIRWIFGTGLLGLLLLYTLAGSMLLQSALRVRSLSGRLLILVFAMWLFLLELKEPFVANFRFASLYMIMYCYICLMPLQKSVRHRLHPVGERSP